MVIYTITYASLCDDQLYTETKAFSDRESLMNAFAGYIRDIAENIDDPDENEEFVKKYATFTPEAHWESWSGYEMYTLTSSEHIINA